jgi:hypothetical protein
MSTSAYQEVLNLVKQLTIDEQTRLLEELTAMVHHQSTQVKHSILELEGLGKDVWKGVDVQAYINQERDSWET